MAKVKSLSTNTIDLIIDEHDNQSLMQMRYNEADKYPHTLTIGNETLRLVDKDIEDLIETLTAYKIGIERKRKSK